MYHKLFIPSTEKIYLFNVFSSFFIYVIIDIIIENNVIRRDANESK